MHENSRIIFSAKNFSIIFFQIKQSARSLCSLNKIVCSLPMHKKCCTRLVRDENFQIDHMSRKKIVDFSAHIQNVFYAKNQLVYRLCTRARSLLLEAKQLVEICGIPLGSQIQVGENFGRPLKLAEYKQHLAIDKIFVGRKLKRRAFGSEPIAH